MRIEGARKLRPYHAALVLALAAGAATPAQAQYRDEPIGCQLPRPGDDENVVLFGMYEGVKQANVTLAGEKGDITHVVDVVIEPGVGRLYVILTSYNSMLWRFTGAVERLTEVVTTSNRRADGTSEGIGGSGVTGVPKEKVSYLPSSRCIPNFYAGGTIELATARGKVAELVRRQPDTVGGAYQVDSLWLPSMTVVKGDRGNPWKPLPVVDVNPGDVVAAMAVRRFGVMPGWAGLEDLVAKGVLEALPRSGIQADYRIVRPMGQFPTGLWGLSLRFLLAPGVPMPGGTPGWACVISEETGKPVVDRPSCG